MSLNRALRLPAAGPGPLTRILVRLGREPAMLGAAALAWFAVLNPTPAVMAAATTTVGWLIRSFSTSKAAVGEAKEAGYDKALADVSQLVKPPPIVRP